MYLLAYSRRKHGSDEDNLMIDEHVMMMLVEHREILSAREAIMELLKYVDGFLFVPSLVVRSNVT